jgi:AcrR family transcriptional regulator
VQFSESEEWIFEATEELLDSVPLHDLTVAMISEAAGVSRQTFYTYFSSKYAVISTLLEDVTQQVFDATIPFQQHVPDATAAEMLWASWDAATDVWAEHRTILAAASENWHSVPEIGELWTYMWENAIDQTAEMLEAQRKTGAAPPGPPCRQLAWTMLWGAERALYMAGRQTTPDMPGEKALVASLVAIWHGAFYGSPAPPREADPEAPRRKGRATS